jgi:transposase
MSSQLQTGSFQFSHLRWSPDPGQIAKSLTGNGIESNRDRRKALKRLTGLAGFDSLALQQDERFVMPWNETDREKYAVIRQRYASDLSDAEFALLEPLLPARKPCGRKPTDARAILNALFYLVRAGCPWRYLPKDFPPFTTVQNRFYAWRDCGLWEQIVSVLVMAVREAEGKNAAPTVVIVDSQSVKTTEAGGPRGYDAGKKVKGRKRHIAVDTLGLPIKCQVTTADVQDRDALPALLEAVSQKSPWDMPVMKPNAPLMRRAGSAQRGQTLRPADQGVYRAAKTMDRRAYLRLGQSCTSPRKGLRGIGHLVAGLVHAGPGLPAHPQNRKGLPNGSIVSSQTLRESSAPKTAPCVRRVADRRPISRPMTNSTAS